jgi:hypothetical protein
MPLHLLASMCLLIFHFSVTLVYESFSPSPSASIVPTARSIVSILDELSRVEVSVTSVIWCFAERHAGPGATPITTLWIGLKKVAHHRDAH